MSNNKGSAGVECLKTCIRIWWKIDGKRERETLHDLKPTPENHNKAKEIADMITLQINMGIFDRHQVFPNSPKRPENYFWHYIDIWQTNQQHTVAPSTWTTYLSRVDHHIRPYWQHWQISKIGPEQVEKWVNQTLQKVLSPKTIRDVLMLFRSIWTYWARKQKQVTDPTSYIKLSTRDTEDINPFTRAEISTIIDRETEPSLKNLWTVMLWSGLSSHELLPLAIEDLDLQHQCLHVSRGFVKNRYRVTKNRRRKRQVELLPIVIAALRNQINLTHWSAQDIHTLERDNKTLKKESLTWLWYNPITGTHFTYDQLDHKWTKHLERCQIPYRSLNNGRHTYASQVLSTGAVTAEWLANQLGHANTQMIHRHYGKFIPNDSRHIISRLSEAISSH